MDKKIFERNFIENLNNNFEKYNKYFDFEYKHFFDLRPQVFQITKCLILELDYADITCINNLLERLLKHALISNEVGIRGIPTDKWGKVFGDADKKYSSYKLGNTIELCRKETLISEKDKGILFTKVRDQIRNGFSHSEPSKILADLSEETEMYQGSLSDPTKLERILMNPKTILPLQSLAIENFAKTNAAPFFEYVMYLIESIEKRLFEIDSQKHQSGANE